MTTLTPTGSLTAVMDELVRLEETVHEELIIYRWRPTEFPQLDPGGAIYNELGNSPFEVFDTAHWKDTLTVIAAVAIRHTNDSEEMRAVEIYADAFRDVVDGALWGNQPLGGTAKRARRSGMRMREDTFNSIPVLAIEFTIEAELFRFIPAHD